MAAKKNIEWPADLVASKGKRLVSTEYVGCNVKYKVDCLNGHIYEAYVSNLTQGRGCPYCSGVARLTIDFVKEECLKRNFLCLSESYKNSKTLLDIKCIKCDFIWQSTFGGVRQGGCRKCAGLLKKDLQWVIDGCTPRNIIVLSTEFKNTMSPMDFRCGVCGWEWTTTAGSVVTAKTGCLSCRQRLKVRNYKKYKTPEEKRLAYRLRSRLTKTLKAKNPERKVSAVRDLGCSIAFLRSYLESKFKPGMTWENWGVNGWHIDHIRPLSSFNLLDRDEMLKAVHYSNLQPLWAMENILKGHKWHS
jgi:hypothetical protein